MGKIVIAIDGFSGCGKSSTAKAVAKSLGYTYIDSGAMYRAATLHFLNQSTELSDPEAVDASLNSLTITFKKTEGKDQQETFLNGDNVENEIRSMRVSDYVSQVSKLKAVRQELVAQQQRLGKNKGVVMDGRDIGTVVFPDAELKIFMTADLEIRSKRRQKELFSQGATIPLEKIVQNLAERDQMDSSRVESPLKKAIDAVEVDTSYMDFEDQVGQIVDLAQSKIGSLNSEL
jgi:CMP/dCMP kinase